jgi:sugar transferase (PEP-CTERM system associated)
MVRLFRVSIPTSVIALLLTETLLLFSCYVVSTYLLLEVDPQVFLIYDGGLLRITLVVIVLLLGLYFNDLYADYQVRSRILLIQQLCLVVGLAFVVQSVLSYGLSSLTLPKWIMIYGSAFVLLATPPWRMLYSAMVSRAIGAQRLLFLGSSPAVREIVEHLSDRPDLGLAAIGYIDDGLEAVDGAPQAPLLGSLNDLPEVIAEHKPDRIVVGLTERRNRLPVHQLLDLRFRGIHIEDAAATYEIVFGRVSTRDLRPSQLVFSTELGPRHWSVTLQSFYSLGLGLVALIVTIPIMLIVAVLIRLTSSGPIFYRQNRVGMNGAVFTLYKFRSMYHDAEVHTGAVWASRDDPRVTPFGRWLRRLRLDELPQLLNVIRGEMALVGPRPERPEFVTTLQEKIPYYRQRHCVKPGVTGWAQINHKYSDTLEDTIVKLEYDLYYIKNLSWPLDLYILFHTAKVMLLARGAH